MGASGSKAAVAPAVAATPNKESSSKSKSESKKSEPKKSEERPKRENDYELAIKSCKELEFMLETEFGSSGSTLHEMITNANASLPIELIMNMRYVATIGNNLVHEKSFSEIPDQKEFIKRYQRSLNALQEISQQRRIVDQRVVQARRKKREAEIQESLLHEDREWLDRQHRELTAQKARRLELEQEKERKEKERLEAEAQQKSKSMCSCF